MRLADVLSSVEMERLTRIGVLMDSALGGPMGGNVSRSAVEVQPAGGGNGGAAAQPTGSADLETQARLLARIDRIPGWPLAKLSFAVIGIAYFFVFYDIADIGYGIGQISTDWHLSSSAGKFVAVAIGLIGYIVGSMVVGYVSDRSGRRPAFATALLLSALGSLGCALAWNEFSLSLFRFITGMGVGAALNIASTYLSEISPSKRRGRYSVITFMVGICGQAVTPFVALWLIPHGGVDGGSGWRVLFAIGAVVGLFGFFGSSVLPESPRWLATHGHLDRSETILKEMEDRFGEETHREITRKDLEPAIRAIKEGGDASAAKWSEFLHSKYGVTALAMATMWFLWYIGNYGFLGDAADLLGSNFNTGSTLFLGIGAIGYPVGALTMAWVADKYERKYLIFVDCAIWFIAMFLVATKASEPIVTVGSFLASFALGCYLQVGYAYTAENYPTHLRAKGFSLSDGVGHAGGAVGALLLPTLVSGTSFFTGFLIIGITGLLAGVIALAGPKSTGRSLEVVAELSETEGFGARAAS